MGITENYWQRRLKRHSAWAKNRFIGFDIEQKAEVEAHMKDNYRFPPNPEVLRGKVLSMPFRYRHVKSIGTPSGVDSETVIEAIRQAFITTSEDCGYQLRKLVISSVKKAIFIIARTSEDRVELTSRASVTGQSAKTAADLIIASLSPERDFPWIVQSIKPEWLLRVKPGTASQPDEIHYGMRVVFTYLTRDEDNIKNVMKRDVMYEGWWQFKYSQEDASPPIPDLDQGSGQLTAPSLDQKSSRRTANRDQSDASWATPSDLGSRAGILLRWSKAAQESHQRRKRRWENIKDYSSLVNQSDRTGLISEWLAEKFSQPSTKTQSGETMFLRVLESVSDHLSTYADVHCGSIDSRSRRLRKSKEGGAQDPNVVFDANGRKFYSPLHKRPRTAWNDMLEARRRIQNAHGYEIAGQQKQSRPKRTRPKRKSRHRGRHRQSGSSALDPSSNNEDNSSYPPPSQQQGTSSMPLTDDICPSEPGIGLHRSDSMYAGQEERVLTRKQVEARLATIEAELEKLKGRTDLSGIELQARWEGLDAERKELNHMLGPVNDLGPSQHSMSHSSRPDSGSRSFAPSSYPGQPSTFVTATPSSHVR
jgi:hypothetical protein